jgi:hypothetical protein
VKRNDHLLWLTKQAIMDGRTPDDDLEALGTQLLEEMKDTCNRFKEEPNMYHLAFMTTPLHPSPDYKGNIFNFLFQLDTALIYGVRTRAITLDFSHTQREGQTNRLMDVLLELLKSNVVLHDGLLPLLGPERNLRVLEALYATMRINGGVQPPRNPPYPASAEWLPSHAENFLGALSGAIDMNDMEVHTELLPSRIFHNFWQELEREDVGLEFFISSHSFTLSGAAIMLWFIEGLVTWVCGDRIDNRRDFFGAEPKSGRQKKRKAYTDFGLRLTGPGSRGANLDISALFHRRQ